MIGNEHNGLGIETLKHRIQRYAAFIGNAMCHADVCPIEDRETYDILTASHHTLQQASYDAPETISASAADVTQYLDQAEDDTTLTPEQQPRETKVGRMMTTLTKEQQLIDKELRRLAYVAKLATIWTIDAIERRMAELFDAMPDDYEITGIPLAGHEERGE